MGLHIDYRKNIATEDFDLTTDENGDIVITKKGKKKQSKKKIGKNGI